MTHPLLICQTVLQGEAHQALPPPANLRFPCSNAPFWSD